MRNEQNLPATGTPFSLSDLLARYVSRQAEHFRQGGWAPDLGGEVVPYDAGPVQPVDARLAWDEALTAVQVGTMPGWQPPRSPADWKGLATAQEPALDLAFCAGNFPQMVRNLHLLLQTTDWANASADAATRTRPYQSQALTDWAEEQGAKDFPLPLLAVGVLRLARENERALKLIQQHRKSVPAGWKAAWANEEAALAWHAGRRAEAADLWQTRGDAAHLPTLFNRGMAALFLGRPEEARTALRQAVAQIPENNSWHHLGRLYLTLAEMRQ